jgi:TRAP-type uncharacterized transport system substrate-binding protein
MNSPQSRLRSYRLAFLTAAFLLILTSCSNDDIDSPNVTIRIHGGSVGGPYNELIELLNTRSETLQRNVIRQGTTDCIEFKDGCPLLSKFNFTSICNDGGSKTNLSRLGMREKEASSSSESKSICEEFEENDFAIVQNYFISGAAQSYCPPATDRFGPDFLYLQFTSSFPFVSSVAKQECDSFFEEQMGGKFEKFDDLRTVLPLYNGLIQFVTANKQSADEETAVTIATLGNLNLAQDELLTLLEGRQQSQEDLLESPEEFQSMLTKIEADEALSEEEEKLLTSFKKRIYLRGINEIYGAAILNKDPRFNSEEGSNANHPEWNFDEDIALGRDDLATLPYSVDIRNFIFPEGTDQDDDSPNDDSLKIGESERGDRMLACGIIDAYVISGEIISEEVISQANNIVVPSACEGVYIRQQIQIPEVIIDSMAAEFPYYEKLPPPSYWEGTHITAMPGLITHLVTTASTDPTLVNELTAALEDEWSNLMLVAKELSPIRNNIAQIPAPLHRGAEQALLSKNLLVYETHKTINIHGGSAGGPYNELIDLLDTRSKTLRSATITNVDTQIRTDCVIFQDGCPLLSRFNFTSTCNDGGSKTNLTRLGMEKSGEDSNAPVPASDSICQASQDNDFGLAQNFFVAGAAQTYCPERRYKLGPDAFYFFEFSSSFPYVRSTADRKRRCDLYFEEQMADEYEKFEDLRIVLPLYNGLVQFVTANRKPADGQTAVELTSLEDLQVSPVETQAILNKLRATNERVLASEENLPTSESDLLALLKKRIYLRGVNEIYGSEILNRDPRFQNENIDNSERKDWRFDEDIVLGPNDLQSLPYSAAILEFINPERTNSDSKIGESVRGDRMLACGIIDAYVISGEIISEDDITHPANVVVPPSCKGDYTRQQIQIPEVIIDAMAAEHPYYQKMPHPAYWDETQITTMPALITYLVTTASADPDLVNELTTALNDDWSSLMLLEQELAPIRENILKKPAPFHEGAELALLNLDLLGGGISTGRFVLIFSIILLIWFAHGRLTSSLEYNRLGEKRRLGFRYLAIQESLDILFIIGVWIFVFMLVVTMIREWDAAIAATQNADDQISGLSLGRTLLWMFTFISSGYEDNVFPSSSLSQVVVGFFAMAGVAYPLYLIAKAWDRIRLRRLSHERGGDFRGLWRMTKDKFLDMPITGSHRSKGTLLLCGWNDRAPGLVYTLTCPDSPFEGMLSIVANPDAERPIEHYKFNKKRVRFYRGDASHRSELERAEAKRASSALVLSENSKNSGKDNTGLLTALAIEQFKDDIAVFAELTVDEGDREFVNHHVDNIIDPRLIARQVLTIGCFDSYVLDFVLDVLSPDDHSEWYSRPVSELRNNLPKGTKIGTAAELSNSLQQYGISVIGICPNIKAENGSVFAPRFDSHLQLNPLSSLEDMHKRAFEKDDDYVICAAYNPDSFKMKTAIRTLEDQDPSATFTESSDSIVKPLLSTVSILIVGHREQAESIAKYIGKTVVRNAVSTATYKPSIVATDSLSGDDLDDAINAELDSQDWSHVLLLSSIPQSQNQEEYTRLAIRADSDTILRASFIRSAIENKGKKQPYITAEVNRTNSRQLSKDAKIDTVVPSSLLVERLLARLVSGGGKVSAMLSAMLSMDDDVCLRSTKLRLGVGADHDHPLIGQSFSKALNTWYKDGRVLGILPKGKCHDFQNTYKKKTWYKENYFWRKDNSGLKILPKNSIYGAKEIYGNHSDDFDWHFIMSPPSAEDDRLLQEGDIVIILDYSQESTPPSKPEVLN